MIENIEEIQLLKTMYILCTLAQYRALAKSINKVRGYPDTEDGTTRYAPLVPQMTAIEYVKDSEGKDTAIVETPSQCVLPILADLQKLHPELFVNYTLVDSYTPKEIEL